MNMSMFAQAPNAFMPMSDNWQNGHLQSQPEPQLQALHMLRPGQMGGTSSPTHQKLGEKGKGVDKVKGKGEGKGKGGKTKARHSWSLDIENQKVGSLPSQPEPWANRPKAFSDGQSVSSSKGEQREDGTGEVTTRHKDTRALDREREKEIVVEAVKSLYRDQIMPHSTHVLRRIKEICGERWRTQQLQQLQQLCRDIPEVTLIDNLECITIMLHDSPEGFDGFVNCSAHEDPFPAHVWFEVENFIQQTGNKSWPRSRYELAKWMRDQVKCLSEYTLGRVCHLVQLCISRRELLGYHRGNIVPYHLSDDKEKKSHAQLRIPMQGQIRPGEHVMQTWEEVGHAIAHVLRRNDGAVKLSQLKVMCRKMYLMELSESALGHAKLSEFLLDPRLKSPSGGSFALEWQDRQVIVVHRASEIIHRFSL